MYIEFKNRIEQQTKRERCREQATVMNHYSYAKLKIEQNEESR